MDFAQHHDCDRNFQFRRFAPRRIDFYRPLLTAADLDREADIEISQGHNDRTERLAWRVAALREGART